MIRRQQRRKTQFPSIMTSVLKIAFIAVFLTILADLVTGYAAWLPCYIEFDPFEVVMNHAILTAEQSKYKVQVEVKDDNMTDWVVQGYTFPADSQTTLYARLRVPEYLMNYPEVQYAIETTTGAEFAKPVMCQGKRSHGRNFFEKVELFIDGNTAPDEITLTAAWASGHSAVSLTVPTVLTKAATPSDGSSTLPVERQSNEEETVQTIKNEEL